MLTSIELGGMGERLRLHEFLGKHHQELKTKYKKLTSTDKSKLHEDLTGLCVERVRIVCTSPKALQQDVNSAFDIMEEEVCNYYILLYYTADVHLSGHQFVSIQVLKGSTLQCVAALKT
jgi:hypothetical protein